MPHTLSNRFQTFPLTTIPPAGGLTRAVRPTTSPLLVLAALLLLCLCSPPSAAAVTAAASKPTTATAAAAAATHACRRRLFSFLRPLTAAAEAAAPPRPRPSPVLLLASSSFPSPPRHLTTFTTARRPPSLTLARRLSSSSFFLPQQQQPRHLKPVDVEEALLASPDIMGDNIIDGKAIAEAIRGEIKMEVDALKAKTSVTPGLAVVLVGNRTDSATYVRMKIKACEEVGIASFKTEFGEDVPEAELIAKVQELNNDPAVHGILVQLPLPKHIHEQKVLDTILPEKDVDGLHPLNLAQLAHTNTHGPSRKFDLKTLPYHAACTPQGCIELIERSGVEIEGKEAVVIGRSNIVGIPVSLLLMQKNATVTIVHSRTKDAAAVCRRADIIVAAVGRAEMVKADFVKPGATVIDVGINSVDDPGSKRGYKLVGDVDFAGAKEVAGKITPVPGGVGPMTIAMLLRNTLQGARRSTEPKSEE